MSGVRAVCPECERVVKKDTEAEAWEVVDNHNEQRHGGEEVAGVHADDVQSVNEMMAAAKENMDFEDYLSFVATVMDSDAFSVTNGEEVCSDGGGGE